MRRGPRTPLVLAGLLLAGCGGTPAGERREGPALGDPGADAVLLVADAVGCAPCARFHARTLPRVVERHVERGALRVRSVLLVPEDDAAARLTAGIRAAGLQDRYWDALAAAYRSPPPGEVHDLLARVEGLDVERALEDLDAPAVVQAARADRALIARHGIDAAPALLAGPDLDRLDSLPAPNLSAAEVLAELEPLVGE